MITGADSTGKVFFILGKLTPGFVRIKLLVKMVPSSVVELNYSSSKSELLQTKRYKWKHPV